MVCTLFYYTGVFLIYQGSIINGVVHVDLMCSRIMTVPQYAGCELSSQIETSAFRVPQVLDNTVSIFQQEQLSHVSLK